MWICGRINTCVLSVESVPRKQPKCIRRIQFSITHNAALQKYIIQQSVLVNLSFAGKAFPYTQCWSLNTPLYYLTRQSTVWTTMKCWAFVALLLCFSLLVSALPLHPRLPHDLIKPRHHVFDRRSNPGNDGRVTPTHDDDPNVPVPGKTGVYYDPKHNVVYAYYGDSLHEHAVHIMINHQLSPENRLPMELASV